MSEIIVNKVKCLKCGDIIESLSVHDFKTCRCGAISIDGGKEYLRRSGDLDSYVELSKVKTKKVKK